MFPSPETAADVTPGDAGLPTLLDAGLLDARLIDARLLDAGLLDARLLDAGLLAAAAEPWLVALRVILAVVFVGMGVLHFVPPVARGMRAMIPPALRRPGWPSPATLVAVTGVCEMAGGLGLVAPWPELRAAAGVALAVFLVAVFPANAYAARHPDRFGRVAVPLIPRLVAQVVLIALVLVAGLG